MQSLLGTLALALLGWTPSCRASQLNTCKTPAHKQQGRQQYGQFDSVPNIYGSGTARTAERCSVGSDIKCTWPPDQVRLNPRGADRVCLGHWFQTLCSCHRRSSKLNILVPNCGAVITGC
jgi:hypothetical protein